MNVNQAISILKENGYKYTDKRENMLRLFADHNRYLSAKDVLEHLKDFYPGLSFDTIYRNLYLFANLNILETTDIEGEKHFRLTCDANHHHHHFICTDCGKTKQIHTCPMSNIAQEMANFEITGHRFEIYGKCPDCAS